MAKALEDRGHSLAVTRPFQLRRYDAGSLPDPGQCTDAIIVLNDRSDGMPRARLALSNGASWDLFAYVNELAQPLQGLAVAEQFDLVPLVRAAVAEMLPSIQAPLRVVQPPAIAHMTADSATGIKDAQKHIAIAVLEVSEHVNRLLLENADLRARIEYIERVALAKVEAA